MSVLLKGQEVTNRLDAKHLIRIAVPSGATGIVSVYQAETLVDKITLREGSYTVGEYATNVRYQLTCLNGSITYSTQLNKPDNTPVYKLADRPSASDQLGLIRISDLGVNGSLFFSDGTSWHQQSDIVLDKFGEAIILIEPAATFLSSTATSADSGNKTTLTSAGVHGLTAAVAVGASVYISAGDGWTPGLHEITSVDVDTTGVAITVDTPFASQGTPTIALANTEVTLRPISIPVLDLNSAVEMGFSLTLTSSGNDKTVAVKHGATVLWQRAETTNKSIGLNVTMQNRNSLVSQISGSAQASGTGLGTSGSDLISGAENTATETTILITAKPSVANERVELSRILARLTY